MYFSGLWVIEKKKNAVSRGIKVPFSNLKQGLSMALVKDGKGP